MKTLLLCLAFLAGCGGAPYQITDRDCTRDQWEEFKLTGRICPIERR